MRESRTASHFEDKKKESCRPDAAKTARIQRSARVCSNCDGSMQLLGPRSLKQESWRSVSQTSLLRQGIEWNNEKTGHQKNTCHHMPTLTLGCLMFYIGSSEKDGKAPPLLGFGQELIRSIDTMSEQSAFRDFKNSQKPRRESSYGSLYS